MQFGASIRHGIRCLVLYLHNKHDYLILQLTPPFSEKILENKPYSFTGADCADHNNLVGPPNIARTKLVGQKGYQYTFRKPQHHRPDSSRRFQLLR